MKRDYYEVLEVERTASPEEIKKSFRRLARRHHPDVNSGNKDSAARFKEINEAYQILSDPEKRTTYDRFGHAAFDRSSVTGQGGYGQNFDPFGNFSGFGDIFDMFFGGSTRTRNQERSTYVTKGMDIDLEVTLEFLEAAFGVEKELSFQRSEICPDCQGIGGKKKTSCSHCRGTGETRHTQTSFFGSMTVARPCTYCQARGWMAEDKCATCRGSGKHRKERKIKIKIPPGVDTGYRLRISGEGEASPNQGPPGDLFLQIKVNPHKELTRKGKDIYFELELSYPQLVLGEEVEVPTLHGQETIRVPAGTEGNTLLRLRGKGLVDPQTGRQGDEVIRVQLRVPRHVTGEHRRLLEQLLQFERVKTAPTNGNKKQGGIFDRLKEAFTHTEE
ncbi:MAG TPA: molecular chaperone DnaJ [Atribacteraceae bacterium]|nr:molecular chaperone DnaJ [Atribacteraceae bacterium]